MGNDPKHYYKEAAGRPIPDETLYPNGESAGRASNREQSDREDDFKRAINAAMRRPVRGE